jgi:CRISPR-associated protein (TIGR03986 family)
MWIETEIQGTFTAKEGAEMVSFSEKRADGRHWAAPRWLVEKGIGGDVVPGLSVRIEVSDDRVKHLQRSGNQRAGARLSASRTSTSQSTSANRGGSPSNPVLPYGFVPVSIEHAVTDVPVWHDGSSGGDLLSGEILCELEALTPLLPGNARYAKGDADSERLHQWGFGDLPDDKPIVEPLRLPDGRVVIAGSALKGMIRQSLGALTSAPMERVGDRHFTYRPNLDLRRPDGKERYVVRPAVVLAGRDDGWDIEVFSDARSAQFVRRDEDALPETTHRRATYKGGIDGQGLLAKAFNPRSRTYREAFVPQEAGLRLHLPKDVYEYYLNAQLKVLSDREIGHLTAHPNSKGPQVDQVVDAIKINADWKSGQLIYVELTTDAARGRVTPQSEVVSCGHHFRYRWPYTSSIREKNNQSRPCLTPIADEQTAGKPERLTGARLLFGYVHDNKTKIGEGLHKRLAGRIAINHAVSEGVPHFLGNEATGYCIPLKILGQPKPSAWEFYLQQPDDLHSPLKTYGDLQGDAGGELAGRKFYRHQPGTDQSDISASDNEIRHSSQATLGRFICQPGTRLRFTIRFARLRPWELGALLAVLEPYRLAPEDQADDYAHKLGLGRPLGMGSVRITREAVRIRHENSIAFLEDSARDRLLDEALRSLREQLRLNKDQVQQWLSAHRVVNGQRLAYPLEETSKDGQVPTTYGWHSSVRRQYSQLRRKESPDWSALACKIRSKKGTTKDP